MPNYYVEANWPRPQIQIDWIDMEITVSTWLDTNLGPSQWAWATGPKNRICVFVQNSRQATLVQLHFS